MTLNYKFKSVWYNPRLDILGSPCIINNILCVDVGYSIGFKPFVAYEWVEIGVL